MVVIENRLIVNFNKRNNMATPYMHRCVYLPEETIHIDSWHDFREMSSIRIVGNSPVNLVG